MVGPTSTEVKSISSSKIMIMMMIMMIIMIKITGSKDP